MLWAAFQTNDLVWLVVTAGEMSYEFGFFWLVMQVVGACGAALFCWIR